MPHLSVNGENIHYREAGAGVPVILVHSLGTSLDLWDSTVVALAANFRVIAIDCRGHGDSSNRGGFSVDAIADDVLAVASALELPDFHYVGISMGGLFGVVACAKAPKRLMSLTLADSYATVGPAGPLRVATTRETLKTISMRDFAADYVRDTLMPATPRSIHEDTVDAIASVQPENYLQTLEAILTADVTPLLRTVLAPTLVIVGENDQRTPVAVSEKLATAIPAAQLVVLPFAGHLSVLDRPDEFNSHLEHFLMQQQNNAGGRNVSRG